MTKTLVSYHLFRLASALSTADWIVLISTDINLKLCCSAVASKHWKLHSPHTFHLWPSAWNCSHHVSFQSACISLSCTLCVCVCHTPEERPPKTSSGCLSWPLGYSAQLCRCCPSGAHRSGIKGAQWCSSCNQRRNKSSGQRCTSTVFITSDCTAAPHIYKLDLTYS